MRNELTIIIFRIESSNLFSSFESSYSGLFLICSTEAFTVTSEVSQLILLSSKAIKLPSYLETNFRCQLPYNVLSNRCHVL
jgi:hypothetical protein